MTQAALPRSALNAALALLCVAAAVLLAWPALEAISVVWSRTDYFGHGYLIPLVALFLAHHQRVELLEAYRDGSPPRSGFLVAGAAAFLELLALIGDVRVVAGLGIPLLLLATFYAVAGPRFARAALLPIGFLALMVPPPGALITIALVRLKLVVTWISVSLLQGLGYTVAANGNQILIPGHTLFVANACSGLTSIITLAPLAFIVALFLSHGFWRRAVIIASVVPLAMFANIVRVTVTVTMVHSQGIEFAQGLLHESFGITTYVGGTLLLIGIAKVLR